jgi:hypothetical protein
MLQFGRQGLLLQGCPAETGTHSQADICCYNIIIV